MKKLKDALISTGLFGGVIIAAFLVGGVFGILQVILVYYFGWYTWGYRITRILFCILVFYLICKIPWDSPKDPKKNR